MNANGKRYKGVYSDPKTETWFYSVLTGKHPDGRPKRELKRGFKTAKAADSARRAVQDSLEKGTHVEPTKETVGEFMGAWLEANKATLRFSTWRSYEGLVRLSIVPYIGY